MNQPAPALPAGLHLVSTPIGAARDITLRALDTLAAADVLVAEDTRSLKHLLSLHGIAVGGRPVWSYHEHSGARVRERIVARIAAGGSVAYAAEAGTPMISDPGFVLARAVRAVGGAVTAVPGPAAAVVALTLAGLPTDRFAFLGFLPPKPGARRAALAPFAELPATLVIYESPKRLHALLTDLADLLGTEREAAMCREMTKRFEEVVRAPLGDLAARVGAGAPRGECVVCVAPRARPAEPAEDDIRAALAEALATQSVRDAATDVAGRLAVPRRRVYDIALALNRRGDGS